MKYIIIPARGGSKGIKNKNLRKIQGMNLVEWSIIHAKFISKKEDKIIISSDSEKILNIAKKMHVIAHKRPDELSGDRVFTEPVMVDAISKYNCKENDLIILLQPTSPLRRKSTILNCLKAVEEEKYDSSLTLRNTHLFFWSKDSEVFSPQYSERPRRQDMTGQFSETGSVYVTKYKDFKKSGLRLSGKTKGIVSEYSESFDIDTIEDLRISRLLSKDYVDEWKEFI